MIFETSRKIYVCAANKITSWSKRWHELHITNFRCEKKMTIFRFFLEKLQIGGNNFSKVINTTVDLIKIVSNHSEVKSEKNAIWEVIFFASKAKNQCFLKFFWTYIDSGSKGASAVKKTFPKTSILAIEEVIAYRATKIMKNR